jgi:hypothetical protein
MKIESDKQKETMCKYCTPRKQNEIRGAYFKLLPTFGFKNDRKYDSWLMKNRFDRKVGIMISTDNSNAVYFNINFCPMCRKKVLGDDKDE